MAIRCENCIHNGVCYLQEVTNDINRQLDEFGCEDYKPATDIAEVKRAKWETVTEIKLKQVSGKIPVYLPKYHGQCSSCSHCFIFIDEMHFKYCPNCGAKMDGERSDT